MVFDPNSKPGTSYRLQMQTCIHGVKPIRTCSGVNGHEIDR